MIVVVGAGAIGSVVAGMLAGHAETILLARGSGLTRSRKGISLRGKVEKDALPDVRESLAGVDGGKISALLLAVKAHQLEEALEHCLPFITEKTLVVPLCNGWGVGEIAARHADREQVGLGVTYIGAEILESGEVVVHGLGATKLGPLIPGSERALRGLSFLEKAFTDAGIPYEILGDMRGAIAEKFLVNVGLNPVGAMHQATNIEVGRREELRKEASALIREAIPLVRKEGFPVPEDFLPRFLGAMEGFGANKNSMWMDLTHGRKTEIAFLNGKVVELGRKHGLPTPENERIVREIRARESREKAL